MKQTMKGLALGIVLTAGLSFLLSPTHYAEWFNSRAPLSDSSNLKGIRSNLARIADLLERLVVLEEERYPSSSPSTEE
jgi:hypothetical protein